MGDLIWYREKWLFYSSGRVGKIHMWIWISEFIERKTVKKWNEMQMRKKSLTIIIIVWFVPSPKYICRRRHRLRRHNRRRHRHSVGKIGLNCIWNYFPIIPNPFGVMDHTASECISSFLPSLSSNNLWINTRFLINLVLATITAIVTNTHGQTDTHTHSHTE